MTHLEKDGAAEAVTAWTAAVRAVSLGLAILCGILMTLSCGGGGGGSAVATGSASALEMPSSIDMTAIEGQTGNSFFLSGSGFDDPGTDYMEYPKETWIYDTEALDMVNDILGVVQNSGYENFVNGGAYKALVNQVGESEQSQGGSSGTSTETEELMEVIIEVTRASDAAPMIVKIWVYEEDGPGGQSMLIRGHFEVTEGVSAEYPCGVLEAHFKGNRVNSSGVPLPGDPLFTMAMAISAENSNVTVQFIDAGEEDAGGFTYEWDNRARVVTNSDMTTGNAYVYSAETNFQTQQLEAETYYFAFNEDYFKFKENGGSTVWVQDKNDLSHRIYRYMLFDKDTGDQIDRASGFPIRLESGHYAYVGYHGMWLPMGCEAETGDTVTRVDTNTEYTLFRVGGKLTRHTRAQVTLEDLTNAEVFVHDNGTDQIVVWDGASSFQKIGEWNHSSGTLTYYQNPVPYTFQNSYDGGWCESMRAWLRLGGLTPHNSDIVYYHAEETITPATAANLDLYYWGFALDAPITQAVINAAPQAEQTYWQGQPTEKHYYFDSQNLTLKEDDAQGEEVLLGSGLNLSGTHYEHGYHMMPLTTNGTYTANTCWDIYEESVYYSWCTGPDEWNQFSTIKDGNNLYVAFDAPLRFSYTHSTDNDINGDATNNGKVYNIEFDGFDMMIPWNYDEASDEWIPAFNLKDGVTLTLGQDEYVIKGAEEELFMNEVTNQQILTQLETTLPINTTIEAPTLAYNAARTALVGDVPTNVELKVIKGELVEE